MRIRVQDIEESAKEVVYEEPTSELSAVFEHGPVHDYEFPRPVAVRLSYYRSGQELFLQGAVDGEVLGECARCLERYSFELHTSFSFVLVPRPSVVSRSDVGVEDLNLSYYAGEEIDLSPLVREQIILAMPTQPLCRPDCRGLCSHCGANRNVGACGCGAEPRDPRLAALQGVKLG